MAKTRHRDLASCWRSSRRSRCTARAQTILLGSPAWRPELNALFASQDAGAEVFLGYAVLEPATNITPPGNPVRYPPPGRFASDGQIGRAHV